MGAGNWKGLPEFGGKIAAIGHGGGSWVSVAVLSTAAIVTTIVICSYSSSLASAARLVDKPDFERKLHARETPLIGGLAMMVPTLAIALIYVLLFPADTYLSAGIFASSVVLLLGVVDDRMSISAPWRLAALIYAIFVALSVEPDFILYSLNLNFLGLSTVIPFHSLAGPLTLLIVVGFINAANLADGMNGQLLGSVLIWSAFLMRYSAPADAAPFFVLFICAGITLVFNLRGRLFSGSAGAYSSAIFIGLSAIATYHHSQGALQATTVALWFWLPVADCIRVMLHRLKARKSPFEGDRDHFHHLLLVQFGQRLALPIYLILLGLPGLVAILDPKLGQIALVGCFAAYWFLVSTRLQTLTTFTKSFPEKMYSGLSVPLGGSDCGDGTTERG